MTTLERLLATPFHVIYQWEQQSMRYVLPKDLAFFRGRREERPMPDVLPTVEVLGRYPCVCEEGCPAWAAFGYAEGTIYLYHGADSIGFIDLGRDGVRQLMAVMRGYLGEDAQDDGTRRDAAAAQSAPPAGADTDPGQPDDHRRDG